jgi:hypothetical protein
MSGLSFFLFLRLHEALPHWRPQVSGRKELETLGHFGVGSTGQDHGVYDGTLHAEAVQDEQGDVEAHTVVEDVGQVGIIELTGEELDSGAVFPGIGPVAPATVESEAQAKGAAQLARGEVEPHHADTNDIVTGCFEVVGDGVVTGKTQLGLPLVELAEGGVEPSALGRLGSVPSGGVVASSRAVGQATKVGLLTLL